MKPSQGVFAAAVSAALCVISLVPAHAAGPAARQALEAQYTRWARARTARDISALVRFLKEETTPDFVFQGPRRTHTKKQELQTYQPVLQGKAPWAPALEYHTTIDQLVVHGPRASVRVTDRAVSRVRDPKITGDTTGKPHELTVVRINRDMWIRTAAGWKLSRREVVGGKQTLDDRPLSLPR